MSKIVRGAHEALDLTSRRPGAKATAYVPWRDQLISIDIEVSNTGMLFGTSTAFRGFFVATATLEALLDEAPKAMDILAEAGHQVPQP